MPIQACGPSSRVCLLTRHTTHLLQNCMCFLPSCCINLARRCLFLKQKQLGVPRGAHLRQTGSVADYVSEFKELTSLATENGDENLKFRFLIGHSRDEASGDTRSLVT